MPMVVHFLNEIFIPWIYNMTLSKNLLTGPSTAMIKRVKTHTRFEQKI